MQLVAQLTPYATAWDLAVQADKPPDLTTSDRQRKSLARDLMAVSQNNRIYFNLCVASVIAIFVAGLVIALVFSATPSQIAALYSATGISVLGASMQMTRLWREKVRADMLLVLARELPPAQLQLIVDVLVHQLV